MHEPNLLAEAQVIASLMLKLAQGLSVNGRDPASQLPLAQLRVCGVLAANGGPRPMSTLGRELGVSLSALTQIADRLERAGLVKRMTAGADRRVRCLQLTARGERIMRRRLAARVERVSAVLAHVPPPERRTVQTALETLLGACRATQGQEAAGREAVEPPAVSSPSVKAFS
jgi:DNA-binding MarR family transcriptional regulator